jgi:hypothetical protein
MIALSRSQLARIDVSTGLNDIALIVPLEVGVRISLGEDDGRERSYTDMTLDEAANVGRER